MRIIKPFLVSIALMNDYDPAGSSTHGPGLIFDFINGFHDAAANSIATVASSKVPTRTGRNCLGGDVRP